MFWLNLVGFATKKPSWVLHALSPHFSPSLLFVLLLLIIVSSGLSRHQKMGGKEETRIFVGGLSWETTERRLEDTFGRFGKVLEAQIMIEKNTGRPRGFGFVTFADKRAVDEAITAMHGRDLDGRPISVNKAVPKVGSDPGYDYDGGGYSSGGRGGYRHSGADRPLPTVSDSDCFKCGRPGHWARECPSTGGGGGGKYSTRPRFGGSGGGRGRDRFGGPDRYGDHLGGSDRYGDRFGGADRFGDRYVDERYDGSRYGDRDRDHVDSRDSRYSGGRDRYGNDRYPTGGDRFSGDRFGGSDRYPQHGFPKETGFGRGGGPRGGAGDRYGSGGGPGHYEGGSGYRERPGPYDRPSRGRRSSYDRI